MSLLNDLNVNVLYTSRVQVNLFMARYTILHSLQVGALSDLIRNLKYSANALLIIQDLSKGQIYGGCVHERRHNKLAFYILIKLI